MKVELSDRALLEMQRIDVSWRKRASSLDVFLDELEGLVKWIETTGVIGPVYDAKAKRQVHRLLLEKSEYHVYLARKSEELIVVVSIWGARRKRGRSCSVSPLVALCPPTVPARRSVINGSSRFSVVSRVRIELTTRGFSIHCSTD